MIHPPFPRFIHSLLYFFYSPPPKSFCKISRLTSFFHTTFPSFICAFLLTFSIPSLTLPSYSWFSSFSYFLCSMKETDQFRTIWQCAVQGCKFMHNTTSFSSSLFCVFTNLRLPLLARTNKFDTVNPFQLPYLLLCGRRFFVSIDHHPSSLYGFISEVSQGSIFGPF